jgi:phosphoenolpyruvate synthase/pyruvate phosphate dikinase
VAVRSSAVDEDGDVASFAGQHETYLNIAGVDAIVAAVRRCWKSALTPRALAYRRERGLATDRVGLAVLIQQLVAADVAAVLFSANPLTGARDEIVINASWGLGESIVGGTVTPDTYVARKAGGALLSRTLAEKRRMTVAVRGGTREVDVPRLLQAQPTLSDAQVAELAALAGSLEQGMGWPVDVECAYASGTLYLLQCRPITTLGPINTRMRAAA